MITGVEIQKIYKEIQRQLFYMIPEKWDKVYLYASIVDGLKNVQAAEMFFYYYPDGLIRKNPVNVYEVPDKFNVDEDLYLKLADKLYAQIKKLKKYTLSTGEDNWGSVTISIENKNFIIEYDYNNIKESEFSTDDRRVIWRYKYLDLPLKSYTRIERKIIQKYESTSKTERPNARTYIEPIKHKYVNNIIDYNSANYNEKIVQKKEKKFEQDINGKQKKAQNGKKVNSQRRELEFEEELEGNSVPKSQFLISDEQIKGKSKAFMSRAIDKDVVISDEVSKSARSQFLISEDISTKFKRFKNVEEPIIEETPTQMKSGRSQILG